MKKLFFLVLVIMVIFSCKKNTQEDLLNQNAETLVMKLSTTLKNVETSINNGDTINLYNVNSQILLSANNNNGAEVRGNFYIFLVDGDYIIDGYNYVGLENIGQSASDQSIFNFKLPTLGLYEVHFNPKSIYYQPVTFFIRHLGMPGEIGDNYIFDHSFRLDKRLFQVNNEGQKEGYIMYIKGHESEFTGVENFLPQAFLFCENNFFIAPNGEVLNGRNFLLKKCNYSEGYFYFSFLKDDCPPVGGYYKSYFYTGVFLDEWWIFPSVYRSDFALQDKIVIKIL